jgi:aerobic carbon-monoxide dehydrogenase medium subunit
MFAPIDGRGEVSIELARHARESHVDGWRTHYERFNLMAQAWAVVGVVAAVQRERVDLAGGRGADPHGRDPAASAVEQALAGADASADAVRAASAHAPEGMHPPSDLAGHADYRSRLAIVLTGRAVSVAAGI